MKYFTLDFFSEDTRLDSITTKIPISGMKIKTIKRLMKSFGADEVQIFKTSGVSAHDFETSPIKTIKLK